MQTGFIRGGKAYEISRNQNHISRESDRRAAG